jgi:hypothetical protein
MWGYTKQSEPPAPPPAQEAPQPDGEWEPDEENIVSSPVPTGTTPGRRFESYEVDFFAKVFEYYWQKGSFEAGYDDKAEFFLRFYSARFCCDMILVRESGGQVDRDEAMILTQDQAMAKVAGCSGDGYRKVLEEHRWTA